ncbi:MAG: ATP-binding protein [Salinisphaera sp.]|nr:ATP-binding protein [Salinisphaera sp.]MDN5937336.1 ATP-binding protein [Salinisphaera sp.]
MARPSQQSLQGLLRAHLGSLVVLLVVTVALSGGWVLVWRHSSQASSRLNGLLVEAQALRGDIYRQMKAITRLNQMPSREDYWRRLYGIDEHFYQMRRYAVTAAENAAITRMHDAYELIGVVLNRLILTTNNRPSEAQVAELLNPAYERWVTGDFESGYNDLTQRVAQERERVQARLDLWLTFAPWVSAVPLILALWLLLRVNRRFRRGFVHPMQMLAQGAAELGRGALNRPVPEQGVSEVRQLARILNTMAQELEDSRRELVARERDAALGALVPVIAHNIRNPLAGIRANAQLLDADASAEEIVETGVDIVDASDRLERWLGALLSYLHPLRFSPVACDLDGIVGGALSALGGRPQAQEVRIERQFDAADDSLRHGRINRPESNQATWVADGRHPVMVRADAPLLEQALHGLLANALEASPPGAILRVALGADGDGAVVTIADQGSGMRIEPDPLAQGPLPSTKQRGTGLGIPFAYKVIHAHGGSMKFADADGGGTQVTINLPLEHA